MALQTSGPISFADINLELGQSSNTQLDLQSAGTQFSLNISPSNWSDSYLGLGMDEFYGVSDTGGY